MANNEKSEGREKKNKHLLEGGGPTFKSFEDEGQEEGG
jgi:hypothetical protein